MLKPGYIGKCGTRDGATQHIWSVGVTARVVDVHSEPGHITVDVETETEPAWRINGLPSARDWLRVGDRISVGVTTTEQA